MEGITPEKKEKIIETLIERGATLPCPRCGNKSFTILDGYFNQSIQTGVKGIVLGERSVPSIALACSRCGFMSQHALGVLGLLNQEGDDDK